MIVLAVLLLISTTVLAAPYGSRSLYSGTFGGDVVELQHRLSDLGYSPGGVDGMFGDNTRQAVIRFQRDYGLVPDGLASKWTFRAVDRAFTWKNGHFYTVRAGDSLWAIAKSQGSTIESIAALNQLQDTMLYPGQVLRVPGAGPDVGPVPNPPPTPKPTPDPGTIPDPIPDPPPNPDPTPPSDPGGQTSGGDPGQTPARTVLGYYAEDWAGDSLSLDSLKNASHQVDLVVNFQLLMDSKGQIITRDYPELMAEAKAEGVKVQGLVHNLVGPGFDSNIAAAVLSSPAVRSQAVSNLLSTAKAKGLAGINVDLENIPPSLRSSYTAFVRELSGALKPAGLSLTLSVPAKTFDDKVSPWSGAFDYKALGTYADKIVPMAYDEHSLGYQPGPVASIGWVDKVAAFAVSQVPKEKILLGIPTYAYDWIKGTTDGRGLSTPQAMSLAMQYGVKVLWDSDAQVPYFAYVNLGQAHVVYFENAQSLAPKLDIVRKYGLGGIGIWRLGLEDPGIWPVIAQKLR
jgi:spore germination protein YaaH